ncbi:Protein kinase domain-containing protein [Fusarium falciforme]|uniref:Protein kinase domain-containing protein n=1 Tax=Fusarium falciforme TaxID=195108 RepID=UPI0023005A1E|nr:Protein kinase domain-containing protein [Fusarium falciforme]WAO89925.1 Protein kinase domain-containing protein [Fusarium falciforme]
MVHLQRCITGNDNRVRAVKEITKDTTVRLENDWISELEAAFKFSHPKYRHCFVRSEAWYELNGRIFMAMEFMPQGDLQTNLQGKPLSEFEGRQIIEQVLEAVGFMHSSGFLHQDLKPSNIMVVSRAPTWYVRVADFGISTRLSDSDTSTFSSRGTLGYIAPEVIHIIPDQRCSVSADMWSLGCVVYKILTGTLPFPQISHLAMYCHGLSEFPRDPLHSCKVSDYGQDFIIKLIQARSEDRLTATSAARHPWITTSLDPSAPRPRSRRAIFPNIWKKVELGLTRQL